MDLLNALVVVFFEVCILLEVAGGALSSNLKQQLSNCYAGRLAQRSLACYWRGLRPHYLSQSYYYLCVVPGLPPVLCQCPYNLVFEESVQTCVPGYKKGANSAALLHSYRTKWSNRYGHRQVVDNGDAHHSEINENHVKMRPWTEGRKRHRRATVNDPPGERSLNNEPQNARHHRDPASHRLPRNNDHFPRNNDHFPRNNDHLELQLHQLSPPHPDKKKILFEDGNDGNINTISDFQGSDILRNGGAENKRNAESAERRSEKYLGTPEPKAKRDMFPVWAIALACLCFIILLIVIVLYLY